MLWPDVLPIVTARCRLEPLTPAHADVMAGLLADGDLYTFTGGAPQTLDELRGRYAAQSVGRSADGRQWWCNWIVTTSDDAHPVGYVQATVEDSAGARTAELAWVIGSRHQGRGLATDAARGMVAFLAERGVTRFIAHIHPDHVASARVASRLGMHRTSQVRDGENQWVLDRSGTG